MASKKAKKMIAKLKKNASNPNGIQSILKKNAKKLEGKMTWPEREFEKILKELKISFEVQKIVGNKIFDFYIPHANLLFEVDGDYWHGNTDTFSVLNGIQKKNIRNDGYKESLALGLGYSIERVWESELKADYEKVKNRVKTILKS